MEIDMATRAQVKEVIKCGKDPNYFIQTYIKIQHPTKGLISFNMYDFQKSAASAFVDHRFNIVLKSRQQGFSTLVAAYSVWLALFQREKNILIIATKMKVAQNFIMKVKSMIKHMPKWLVLPAIVSNNKQEMIFDNGSQVKAISTSEDAGRSEALSLLIVDEAAFVRNFDTIWTGLYPTLSTGGRAIILSTPNGVGGQYHKLYTDADAGLNEFNAIKVMWHDNPDYDQAWFDKMTANLSKRQIAQEYLCDFSISGDTFLDDNTIEWIGQMTRKPMMREHTDNNVWIWKQPLSENEYVISADVSRGDAKDYSTFHVIDTSMSEVVAEYKGKIRPDDFGVLIDKYGRKYNNALVCPENNSYGYATILKLQDLRYPRLYCKPKKGAYVGGYIPPSTPETAGFNTNGKTRPLVLSKLEEVLRNKQLLIYSERFYAELKTFAVNSGGRASAKRGYNDDLVMSLAIGAWLFEAEPGFGASSKILNAGMLQGMSKKTKTIDDVDSTIHSPVGVYSPNSPSASQPTKSSPWGFNARTGQGNIHPDMMWVLK